MNKKVLVTGGAGYIGSHTVVALHEAGYTPVIIDNYENSSPDVIKRINDITSKDTATYELDACNLHALSEVWEKESPDYVIHFAAKKAVGESVAEPLLYYRNNIVSLLNVLECAQRYNTKSVVFSSSCTVYGDPDTCPVTEKTPEKPATSPYGATKQMCERILKDFVFAHSDSNVIALRYFNPVGAHPSAKIGELPNGTPNNLVPYLTQATAGLRGPLTVFGNDYDTPDGTCIRDFIHVMDLAEAHVASLSYLNSAKESFTALNIGTGKGNSVMELITAFETATGQKVPYSTGPRRAGDVIKIWADTTLSRELLNWTPKRTLEDSMRDSWNWQKALDNK
jgi:UDP-glucose 4-epimerase